MVNNKQIDTHSPVLMGHSKKQIRAIRIRNKEIEELREIVICLTNENIKMREELKVRGIKWGG